MSKLTPASSLDQGALLYEAGRASVPSPWRAWALVGVLALTQTLTLAALLMPMTPAPAGSTPGAHAPGPPERSTPPLDGFGSPVWHMRQLPEEPPAGDVPPDRPALRPVDIHLFD